MTRAPGAMASGQLIGNGSHTASRGLCWPTANRVEQVLCRHAICWQPKFDLHTCDGAATLRSHDTIISTSIPTPRDQLALQSHNLAPFKELIERWRQQRLYAPGFKAPGGTFCEQQNRKRVRNRSVVGEDRIEVPCH